MYTKKNKFAMAMVYSYKHMLTFSTNYPESQKSIDFRAAAFLDQNISAKVRKTQHFVLFEKKRFIFLIFNFVYFSYYMLKRVLIASSYIFKEWGGGVLEEVVRLCDVIAMLKLCAAFQRAEWLIVRVPVLAGGQVEPETNS